MQTLNINIKDWYGRKYPTDTWGKESISEGITFNELLDALDDEEVHVCFSDSIVRERCFEKLSELLDCDYDVVYYKWLYKDNAKKYYNISN